MIDGLIIDSFAGGGGASTGIEWALGRSPDIAINHNAEALAMHAANHPGTLHLTENIWKVDPIAVTGGKPVLMLWASPDCRHHSKAKGGAPVSASVRGLADVVLLWAELVAPTCIFLENVEEWRQWGPLGADGKPCPFRKGAEFARWVRALEALGYTVAWWELRACDYGAPTIRKRLYVVARRDGRPILRPAPSHAAPGSAAVLSGACKPWRTAAQIIDWSLPCPSIFLTRDEAKAQGVRVVRPLADKTLARIARGFKRYVLERAEPFVVIANHGGDGFRGQGLADPLVTVAASPDALGVVTPFVTKFRNGATGSPMDEPVPTVTANSFIKRPGGASPLGVVVPHLMTMRNSGKPFEAADAPTHTVTAGGAGLSLVSAFLSHAQQGGRSRPADAPLHTVCASAKDQNQIVTAFLAQQNGGPRGPVARAIDEPAATLTTAGAQIQPVFAYLAALQNNAVRGDPAAPLGTVLAAGNHHAVIAPFMSAYYGTGDGAGHDEPARTVTTHDRFGHVEASAVLPPFDEVRRAGALRVAAFLRAQGVWDGPGDYVMVGSYVVWDIGLRMLNPRELARAQGFPDAYVLAAPLPCGGALSETAQRHKIGNSVCPPVAAAIVRANLIDAMALPVAKRRRRATIAPWPGLPVQPAGDLLEARA